MEGGSYSLIDVLEQNGINHNLATAIEGAITYVAGIKDFNLLGQMVQYIQDAMNDGNNDYYDYNV